jgi:RNA polymerase sigma-70 factor (ECF subfamily)
MACRLVERLSGPEFDTFVMAELEDLSVPEIAARLHANVNTTYSRLRSARIALKRGIAGDAARL